MDIYFALGALALSIAVPACVELLIFGFERAFRSR